MEALHQPGDIIDQRYRILDILGKGGIGTTYATENLQTAERVALKVVSLRGTNDPKILELFEREARILSQLNHFGIPRYLDYFQVNKRRNSYFYLAQQLVEGQSLFELVKNGWQPQEVEVWHLANQILDILVYLQQFTPPVIHRDIKPHNIIRRSDGKVFLVDFGAVQDVYHGTLTGGSTVAGTYGYMAPEQFRSKTVLATDLYGLGATLIFLLTQKDPADLPKRKLKIDFRPHIRVTKRFADWLERMIEPVAEDRFCSAGEALMVWQGKKELTSSALQKIDQSIDSKFIHKKDDKQQIEVITSQFIQFFKFLSITAKVSIENTCLTILLESDKLPDQQISVAFIRRQLMNCDIESIQSVQICGRESVGNHQAWRHKFKKFENSNYVLPSGCILKTQSIEWNDIKDNFLIVFYTVLTILIVGVIAVSISAEVNTKLEAYLYVFYTALLVGSIPMIFIIIPSLIIRVIATLLFANKKKKSQVLIEKNKKIIARADLVESKNIVEITYLKVEEKWRRRGLGSAIVKHIIQESNKPIRLICYVDLIDFYWRLGFIQSGTPSRYGITTMVYPKK